MNKLSKLLFLSIALCLTVLVACKKSKNVKSHTIEYKIIASATADINTIIHTNNQGDITTLTGISSKTWSSGQITFPSSTENVAVSANGMSSSAEGTLTVQIYVDGELQKENVSTGTILSAAATYQF